MSDSPRQSIIRNVKSVFPREKWAGVRTLVAVSGGPDSVALLRVLCELDQSGGASKSTDLVVAYVNHGIRGVESDRESEFVRGLASRLGIECHLLGADGGGPAPGNSEESLRDFRYEQLQKTATRLGARYLVMGHNFDDQVETILFRIFRSTGITGLAGMPAIRLVNESLTIVRPLIETSRAEIEEYLNSIGQRYCLDRSNSDSRYTRNFLRNDLLPQIKKRFGESVSHAIVRLGEQARQTDEFLKAQTIPLDRTLISCKAGHVVFDCKKLSDFPSVLVRRWIAEIWVKQDWPRGAMTQRWWGAIDTEIRCSAPDAAVLNLPGNIRFEKRGTVGRISSNA